MALAIMIIAGSCATENPQPEGIQPAKQLWAQPESASSLLQPHDVAPNGRTSAWVADRAIGALIWISGVPGEGGMFGRQDQGPAEVVRPVRAAASREHGVAAYDLERKMIDVFTSEGQVLASFDPGVVPAVMEVSRMPRGLVYASLLRQDSATTTLFVTYSDFRGGQVDTLLGPTVGPETLRTIPVAPRYASIVASGSGFWVWTRAVPDTVFEVAHSSNDSRKIVVDRRYEQALGLLGDPVQDMLWFVWKQADGLDFDGFDVSSAGLEPYEAPLVSQRSTPGGFQPMGLYDGAVLGWTATAATRFRLTSYELQEARNAGP
jgi:hypothetical protein